MTAPADDAPLLFRADHGDGYSTEVFALPAATWATKRPVQVQVAFAERDAVIATREGEVATHAGDAIVTGKGGERWPVGRNRFDARYAPLPPTRAGQPGTYVSRPQTVRALQMGEPFIVELADGVSHLNGRPGDWLVDYGDGSLGVVAQEIFPTLYELAG